MAVVTKVAVMFGVVLMAVALVLAVAVAIVNACVSGGRNSGSCSSRVA